MLSKRFLVLGILICEILSADPVPIIWTGPPEILSALGGSPYGSVPPEIEIQQSEGNAEFSANDSGYVYGPGPFQSASFEIPFSLANPAEVSLSINILLNAFGTSCGDVNCNPNLSDWAFTGGISGTASIIGNNLSDLIVPFGSTGSVPADCEIGVQCSGGLTLTDNESGIVFLDSGDYSEQIVVYDWNNSLGDSYWTAGISGGLSDPVEAPEPSSAGMLGILVLLVGLKLFVAIKQGNEQ
jgi:hypothetical protein